VSCHPHLQPSPLHSPPHAPVAVSFRPSWGRGFSQKTFTPARRKPRQEGLCSLSGYLTDQGSLSHFCLSQGA